MLPAFWHRPQIQTFSGSAGLEALQRVLESQEARTDFLDLSSAAQLELTQHGATADNWRLSINTFRRVCSEMATGLRELVADMLGYGFLTVRLGADTVAVPEAVQIFNMVLRRRFRHVLEDKVMLVDTGQRVIDGIVSVSYQRLSNLDFLEYVSEAVGDGELPMSFESATLVGRWLSLHFTAAPTLWTNKSGKALAQRGSCFINSEAGECTVRAATSVHLGGGRRFLLGGSRRDRVSHSGKKFGQRWRGAVRSQVRYTLDADWLRFALGRLEETTLGFGGADEEADDRMFRRLVARLHASPRIQAPLARRCLRAALRWPAGEDRSPDGLLVWDRKGWAKAHYFDLLYSLTRETPSLAIHMRDHVERKVGRMLSARFLGDV